MRERTGPSVSSGPMSRSRSLRALTTIIAIMMVTSFLLVMADAQANGEPEGTITVFKYEDQDGDGDWDTNASLGWFFELRYEGGGEIATKETDEMGMCIFEGLGPGEYEVEEVDGPDGWYHQSPTVQTVTLTPDDMDGRAEFINSRYGKMTVWKFEDRNGNGILGPDDFPAGAGWEFELRSLTGEVLREGVTGFGGYVEFEDLTLRTYHVVEVGGPDGWYHQGPTEQILTLSSPDCLEKAPTFVNSRYGQIIVEKMEDQDGDGKGDISAGEGWSFEVFDESGTSFGVKGTDVDGECHFGPLELGKYTVVEQGLKDGWYHQTSTVQHVDLVSDGTDAELTVTFVNARYGNLTILKMEDIDGDGEGDEPLPDWCFHVIGPDYDERVCTGPDGRIRIIDLKLGEYTIAEILKDGWYCTDGMTRVATLSSPDELEVEVTFLNIRYGSIKVCKYDNATGEPLEGWVFDLYDGSGKHIDTGTTGPDGCVTFSDLRMGTYHVTERPQPGWEVVGEPTQVAVIDGSGGNVVLEFLNERGKGSITVEKLEDIDGDGIGDVAVEGWGFTLHSPDGTEIAGGVTDGNGELTFSGLDMGTYTVKEVMPMGWYPHGPTEVELTLDESSMHVSLTFVNSQYACICGYKFLDEDRDGTWDDGEPPIAGWQIELYVMDDGELVLEAVAITDEHGHYCFDGLLAGATYVVREVMETGYGTVMPTEYEVTLSSGEEFNATFGNWREEMDETPGHTIGFWKNNLLKNSQLKENGVQVPFDDMQRYMIGVTTMYGDEYPFLHLTDADSWDEVTTDEMRDASETLDPKGKTTMQERAEAQILALLLTQQLREDQMPGSYTDSVVEIPSMTGHGPFVGTMSEAIDAILDAYDSGDHEWAKDAADYLNNITDDDWPFPY